MREPTRKKIDTTIGEIEIRPLKRGEWRRFMEATRGEMTEAEQFAAVTSAIEACVVTDADLDELEGEEWNSLVAEVVALTNGSVSKN